MNADKNYFIDIRSQMPIFTFNIIVGVAVLQ